MEAVIDAKRIRHLPISDLRVCSTILIVASTLHNIVRTIPRSGAGFHAIRLARGAIAQRTSINMSELVP